MSRRIWGLGLIGLLLIGILVAWGIARTLPKTLPGLVKSAGILLPGAEEATPLVVGGRKVIMSSLRHDEVVQGTEIDWVDWVTGKVLARTITTYACGAGMTLPDGRIVVSAVKNADSGGGTVALLFFTSDFKLVETREIYRAASTAIIYNTSLASDGKRYVLAVENSLRNSPTGGHPYLQFIQSADLHDWRPVEGIFDDRGHYASAPTLRYSGGWWYVLYTAVSNLPRAVKIKEFVPLTTKTLLYTAVARTHDFRHYLYAQHALLVPDVQRGEGLCNCDADLVEDGGKTYLTYNVGTQLSLAAGGLKTATFAGSFAKLMQRAGPYWLDSIKISLIK